MFAGRPNGNEKASHGWPRCCSISDFEQTISSCSRAGVGRVAIEVGTGVALDPEAPVLQLSGLFPGQGQEPMVTALEVMVERLVGVDPVGAHEKGRRNASGQRRGPECTVVSPYPSSKVSTTVGVVTPPDLSSFVAVSRSTTL